MPTSLSSPFWSDTLGRALGWSGTVRPWTPPPSQRTTTQWRRLCKKTLLAIQAAPQRPPLLPAAGLWRSDRRTAPLPRVIASLILAASGPNEAWSGPSGLKRQEYLVSAHCSTIGSVGTGSAFTGAGTSSGRIPRAPPRLIGPTCPCASHPDAHIRSRLTWKKGRIRRPFLRYAPQLPARGPPPPTAAPRQISRPRGAPTHHASCRGAATGEGRAARPAEAREARRSSGPQFRRPTRQTCNGRAR